MEAELLLLTSPAHRGELLNDGDGPTQDGPVAGWLWPGTPSERFTPSVDGKRAWPRYSWAA